MFEDSRIEKAKHVAHSQGVDAAKAVTFDVDSFVNSSVPDCFGLKWQSGIKRIKKLLNENFPPVIYLYAVQSFAYAKNHTAAFINSLKETSGKPYAWSNDNFSSADGVADSEGWAFTLYNHLESTESDALFDQLMLLDQKLPSGPVLDAIAVVWFYEAAVLFDTNSAAGLDRLYEVSDAIGFGEWSSGWNGGAAYVEDDKKSRAKEIAKNAAFAKHSKHADARKKLVGIWKSGGYKTKNDCVTKELPDLIVYCEKKIAYKTAREWLNGIDKD